MLNKQIPKPIMDKLLSNSIGIFPESKNKESDSGIRRREKPAIGEIVYSEQWEE